MHQKIYYKELDSIRAVAAFSILIAHCYPCSIFARVFHFGRFGVILFFIVSGFLIIDILLSYRQKIECGSPIQPIYFKFFLKRALRIFPPYYGIIVVLYCIGDQSIKEKIYWHLFYCSNYGQAFTNNHFASAGHLWSLCVEEQFYTIIPFIILCCSRQLSLKIMLSILVISIFVKIMLAFLFKDWLMSTKTTFGNFESLIYGAMIAYSLRDKKIQNILFSSLKSMSSIMLLILISLMAYRYHLGDAVYDKPLYISLIDISLVLVFGHLILCIAHQKNIYLFKFLNNRTLRYLGKISYGIYLYHPFVAQYLKISHLPQFWSFCYVSSMTVILSMISWHFFEKRILSLKEKFL